MRQTVITSGIAHWNTADRHTVRITDEADGLLDWYPIALPRDRPGTASIIPQIRRWQRGAAGVGERYRTLYCIVFGKGTGLWEVTQP